MRRGEGGGCGKVRRKMKGVGVRGDRERKIGEGREVDKGYGSEGSKVEDGKRVDKECGSKGSKGEGGR